MEATQAFNDIYKNRRWGVNSDGDPSSGPGSHPSNVVPYVEYLQRFMKDNNVKTIVDVGCGDWQFARYINWDGVEYLGVDCVKSVLQRNIKRFAKDNVDFALGDLTNDEDLQHFPTADLYIVKDVLQHLPNRVVYRFLDDIKPKVKYILVTNCCDQARDEDDADFGETRPLNSSKTPLRRYNAEPQLNFFTKETSLIRGDFSEHNMERDAERL